MNLTELKFDLLKLKAQLLLAKGNWGHQGRPGHIGGSGSGGGVERVAEILSQGIKNSVVFQEISIDDLRTSFITNRKINKNKVEKIAKDIVATKQMKPVIVTVLPNGKFHLEEGHHRLLAMKSVGANTIPAYIVDKSVHNMNTLSGQNLSGLYKASKEKEEVKL